MSDRAAQIREAFPQCVAVADAFRAAFGSGVKITWAEESGRSVGRKLDESRYTVISGADLVIAARRKDESRG